MCAFVLVELVGMPTLWSRMPNSPMSGVTKLSGVRGASLMPIESSTPNVNKVNREISRLS
jgi:hypothetical protein